MQARFFWSGAGQRPAPYGKTPQIAHNLDRMQLSGSTESPMATSKPSPAKKTATKPAAKPADAARVETLHGIAQEATHGDVRKAVADLAALLAAE